MVCEPPSRVKVSERGSVIVRNGAFWQAAKHKNDKTMRRIRFISCVTVVFKFTIILLPDKITVLSANY